MTTATVTMQAPSTAYTNISCPSGNQYSSSATGLVANVQPADIIHLLAAGYTEVNAGWSQFQVPLLLGRNLDGSALAATAAAGKFGASINLGTADSLVSLAANNSTVAAQAIYETVLPTSFGPGYAPTITVNGDHVLTTGATLGAHTIGVAAYVQNNDGTQSSNIVTTAAQNTSATATDLAFATSTTALLAVGRVLVEVSANLVETAGTNAVAHVNSLRFS